MQGIDSVAGLEALAPEWGRLCERVVDCTPFQRPDWVIPYCRVFAGGKARALAIFESGQLVALFPFYILEEQGAAKLLLLGTGVSDYLDALVAPEVTMSALGMAFEELASETGAPWRVCELQQLPPGAVLEAMPVPSGWEEESGVQTVCPVLALGPGSGGSGGSEGSEGSEGSGGSGRSAAIPAAMQANLRYCRCRVAPKAAMIGANEGNFPEIFGALMDLHEARCRQRGEVGGFHSQLALEFHQQAAWNLLRSGVARLFALKLGNEWVGVYYGMHQHGRAYFYNAGFDPQYAALSPGTLLIGHAIDCAQEEGATEFHFLRGDEPYKYRWGAINRVNSMRRLWKKKRGVKHE